MIAPVVPIVFRLIPSEKLSQNPFTVVRYPTSNQILGQYRTFRERLDDHFQQNDGRNRAPRLWAAPAEHSDIRLDAICSIWGLAMAIFLFHERLSQ